jgi:hypothetical protein
MEGDNELAGTPAEDDVKQSATDEVVKDDTARPEGDDAPETVEKPEGGDTDDADKPEEKKKPSGAERNKRRLQLVQAELDRLARENEELRRPKEPSKDARPGIDREPTEGDFPNDYFAYERARTAWDVRQAIREETGRRHQERQQELQREIRAERVEAYEENKTVVRDRIPDFDKVVSEARSMTVSDALADELLASDKPALLQYHLAKNPDQVRELNQLSGKELARAIGRLEARLHLPKPKQATEAAAPPSSVKGKAAPPFDPFKTDDMNAYAAWRKKQGFGSR